MIRLAPAVLVLALASCGSVRVLREAQDHFNRAAEIENQARLPERLGIQVSSGAESEYRAALSKLKRELKENAGALKEDGLWHSARLLKVLCHWRVAALGGEISEFKEARAELASLAAAKEAGDYTPGVRDRGLLAALPGLLDHEKGLREKDPAKAAADFDSADKVLAAVLADPSLPADHELRYYLRLARLAALRERMKTADTPEEKKQARERFEAVKNPLKAEIDPQPAFAALKRAAVAISQAAGVTW